MWNLSRQSKIKAYGSYNSHDGDCKESNNSNDTVTPKPCNSQPCMSLKSDEYLEIVNKSITNTVKVPATEYMMNIASGNASKNILSNLNYSKPISAASTATTKSTTQWNQSSDRAFPSMYKIVSRGQNVPSHGSSTKTSLTRHRPGAGGPPGKGVDIKHNSYHRYLLKKKGLVALRGENNSIMDSSSKKIQNNKWKKDGIIKSCCTEYETIFTLQKGSITLTDESHKGDLDNRLNQAVDILHTIIVKRPPGQDIYNIIVNTEDIDGDTIGFAGDGQITLNDALWTGSNHGPSNLNDNSDYNIVTTVIVHEILHILGLINVVDNSSLWGVDPDTDRKYYLGTEGNRQYKQLLSEKSIDTSNILGIPIEDDGGSGTHDVHFEEGIDSDGSDEEISIGGTIHPVLTNEIMSGWLNTNNYLTTMTLGSLEDLDFVVNYNAGAPYILNSSSGMIWHGIS